MTRSRDLNWQLLASISAVLILAAPLWCVASPAMPDYPAHLASFYLIGGGASQYFRVEWAFVPNLAGEMFVPLLAKLMPLEIATKLFLTITVGLWVLGPATIQRALFGKAGLGGLFAASLTYNAAFLWGFFNYTFAIGLSFFVLAGWIATEGRRRSLHLAGFAAAFVLVYFLHLFALATLVLMISCFELAAQSQHNTSPVRQSANRLAILAALLVPAAFCFFVLKPAGDDATIQFNLFDTMAERFEAAIQLGFDQPAYAIAGTLIALFVIGLATRRLHVATRMKLGLLILLLCTIFAPESALGGWGVHLRLPSVLGAIALASSDTNLPRRWMLAGVASALVLFAFQATTLASQWRKTDLRYSEFRAAANAITANDRLLTVLDGVSLGWSADQPYWHMAEFAVIDRSAFTPLLFTTRGQHVIHLLEPMKRFAAATALQGSPPDIDELNDLAAGRHVFDQNDRDLFPYLTFFQCHYDQAVVINGDEPVSRAPAMLRLRHMGSFFAIYDIVRGSKCTRP